MTEKFGPPKGKEKKGGDKKNAASSAAAPASDAAAQKSKKKPVHEKLPPIDMNAPSGVIAQQLLSLAADTNKQHALEMIADVWQNVFVFCFFVFMFPKDDCCD